MTPSVRPSPVKRTASGTTDNCLIGTWQGGSAQYSFDIPGYGPLALDSLGTRLQFRSTGLGYALFTAVAEVTKVVNGQALVFHFSGASRFVWRTTADGRLLVTRDPAESATVSLTVGGVKRWSHSVYLDTHTYDYACSGNNLTLDGVAQRRV
jgi:hypothetical protein